MNWIGLFIGAALGWLIGYIFRCQNGTCPITSHWWIPTLMGAIFGLTWTMGKPAEKQAPGENQTENSTDEEKFIED
ncbi:MAG: DUF6132 family protein [bacterium]|nr:DUF6132 family protein [bacterium]